MFTKPDHQETAPAAQEPSAADRPQWYNPFAEPRTIPSGWDMSEFLKSSEAESLSAADSKDGLNL